jgi:acetate---CoA ligase (ADP-forming)
MPSNSLNKFFEPRGVIIVGARRSPGFGYGIPLFLQKQGWGDRIHLVNPAGGEMHGLNVYKKVGEVPASADLAIVIVPAAAVPGVLEEIGAAGIKNVIIESAGFAETGAEGLAQQERAKAIAARYRMRLIGPNCVGVVNTVNGFASVELIEESLAPGPISIIAQSGVFGNILLDHLHECGLYVSKAVTLGNRIDVNESDILDYLENDPLTRVIMLYLEGAADGPRLRESLSRVTRNKPVLILKSGRTAAGKRATASHTGSMSGQDDIYSAVFTQTGAVRAESLNDLIAFARVFATQPVSRSNRLGILTTSGSLGALATDVAESNGLVLPQLSQSTVDRAREIAPGWMNVKNPLDLGPSGNYGKLLSILLSDPVIDMALAIMVIPYAVVRNFKALGIRLKDWFGDTASIRAQFPEKPVLSVVVGHREFAEDIAAMNGDSMPVFDSPEQAALALAALWRYSESRKREVPRS